MADPVRVGVMQGRLLPPYEGRFQAFPADGWDEEMRRARAAGLDCIEWIYEVPHEADNPLGTDDGQARMRALCEETGVAVWSVCADHYMDVHLVDREGRPQADALDHLRWLIGRAARFGIRYMVLPFVDRSSLSPAGREALPQALAAVLPAAEAGGVELHLETDLPPTDFAALLTAIGHPLVKANHDIGNSASLGFDPTEELTTLAPWIGSVHVKDRVPGGGTVPLGSGGADFPTTFKRLHALGFARWYILQAARGAEGGEVELARQNRAFVERHVASSSLAAASSLVAR